MPTPRAFLLDLARSRQTAAVPPGLVDPAKTNYDMNTYRVWLSETAYYVVTVKAESAEAAIDAAEHPYTSLPKPYDYSPVVATKTELVKMQPRSSHYKPARRRW